MDSQVLRMKDGADIFTVMERPKGQLKGHVHILHGMSEHIGRYEDFMGFMSDNGYAVSGHDHRGHGKTSELSGKLGHFGNEADFETIVEDAHQVIEYYQCTLKNAPLFLLGHSMGSFAARRYVQLYPGDTSRLLLLGTGGDPGLSRSVGTIIAKARAKTSGLDEPDPLLNALIFGSYAKSVEHPQTPFDWLSRDKKAVSHYMEDPLCGAVPTTKFFLDLFEGLKRINEQDEIENVRKDLPILFMSGSEDPVGGKGKGVFQAAGQYEKAGVNNVTVMLYEGGRHEILHEINQKEVYEDILKWMGQI